MGEQFGGNYNYTNIPLATPGTSGGEASTPVPTTIPSGGGGVSAIGTKFVIPVALPMSRFSYSVMADRIVRFINQSTGAVRFLWNFGDGQTSTVKDPFHTYAADGTYTVKLRAYNSESSYVDYSAAITIATVLREANFTYGASALAVYVRNTSTAIGTPNWDFGDGTMATGEWIYHLYDSPGTYNVTLSIGGYQKSVSIGVTAPAVLGDFVGKFGSSGSGDGQFNTPHNVHLDGSLIYVADRFNNRIQIFNKSTYAFVAKFGSAGSGNGQFSDPRGIATDSSYVYVVDAGNSRVQYFDKTTRAYAGQFGTAGIGDGQFTVPTDILIEDDDIFVVDSGSHRIQQFSRITHTYVNKFGIQGEDEDGKYYYPRGIAGDGTYFYISDQHTALATNYAVQKIRKSDKAFMAIYRVPGDTIGHVGFISGNVYVPLTGLSKIRIVSAATMTYSAEFGGYGSGDGQFDYPFDAAADDNYVYVADSGNHRVEIFSRQTVVNLSEPPAAAFTVTPASGNAPLPVTFTDASTNTPTSWQWQFGDGTTSALQNPSHIYTAPGIYKVQLTATNATGSSEPAETLIVATEAITPSSDDTVFPPVASFTADVYSGTAPLTVQFTDTSTNSPTAWEWSIDGVVFSTSQNPSHVFSDYGTYVVKLTVTKDVWTSESTRTILVTADANLPPFVTTFSADTSAGLAPLAVTFTAAATGSPTAWEWRIDGVVFSTSQNPSYTFSTPGVYTVMLTVTNAYGSTSVTMQIVVAAADVIPQDMPFYIGSQKIGYYLVDTNNHRVIIYEKNGTYIKHFGSLGSGSGQFIQPTRLALIGGVQLLDYVETEL